MRHFIAIGPAVVLLAMIIGAIMLNRGPHSASQPISRTHLVRPEANPSPWPRIASLAFPIWGEAAAIYFLADAMRRKYRGGRAVAVAFALMGLISLGMTSLLYYAFWGHRPLEPETAVYGSLFCPQCLAATTDSAAPSALAWNLVFGTRYMGSSERCERCNSVVRTLWAWVVFPIVPLGSYRIIATDTYRFIGRRDALRRPDVAMVYGIALAVVAMGAIIYAVHR